MTAGPVWPLPSRPSRTLPVAGGIAAGLGRAFDADEDVVEVEDGLAGPGRYALRVSGDSLVDLGIFDGDQVVVDPDHPFHEGDLVAALLPFGGGDEVLATLKVYVRRDSRPWLVRPTRTSPRSPSGEASSAE